MSKRITVLLDDDLYAILLERAGSTHKISHALNPLLRVALTDSDVIERARARERLSALEGELATLRDRLEIKT